MSALTAGAVVTGSVIAVSFTGVGAARATLRGFTGVGVRFGLFAAVLLVLARAGAVDFGVAALVVFFERFDFSGFQAIPF